MARIAGSGQVRLGDVVVGKAKWVVEARRYMLESNLDGDFLMPLTEVTGTFEGRFDEAASLPDDATKVVLWVPDESWLRRLWHWLLRRDPPKRIAVTGNAYVDYVVHEDVIEGKMHFTGPAMIHVPEPTVWARLRARFQ